MAVDLAAISASLKRFVRSHNAEFQKLSNRQSQLLEIGAMMISAKHYEISGYSVYLHNPSGNRIKVKLGTRGNPWNFSRFEIERDGAKFEIHRAITRLNFGSPDSPLSAAAQAAALNR